MPPSSHDNRVQSTPPPQAPPKINDVRALKVKREGEGGRGEREGRERKREGRERRRREGRGRRERKERGKRKERRRDIESTIPSKYGYVIKCNFKNQHDHYYLLLNY